MAWHCKSDKSELFTIMIGKVEQNNYARHRENKNGQVMTDLEIDADFTSSQKPVFFFVSTTKRPNHYEGWERQRESERLWDTVDILSCFLFTRGRRLSHFFSFSVFCFLQQWWSSNVNPFLVYLALRRLALGEALLLFANIARSVLLERRVPLRQSSQTHVERGSRRSGGWGEAENIK